MFAGLPPPVVTHSPVELSPLRPGETRPVVEVFDGMSARSRHLRFMVAVPRLTGSMLRALTDVHPDRHVAVVARRHGVGVGIGRYVVTAPGTAEVALAVSDAHQGRGIGRELLDRLAADAAGRGVEVFTFTAHSANRRVLRLFAARGAVTRFQDGLVEGHFTLCAE